MHACEQTSRLGRTVSEALNNLYALSYLHAEEKAPSLSMEQAHAALRNAVRALRDHIREHRCDRITPSVSARDLQLAYDPRGQYGWKAATRGAVTVRY